MTNDSTPIYDEPRNNRKFSKLVSKIVKLQESPTKTHSLTPNLVFLAENFTTHLFIDL